MILIELKNTGPIKWWDLDTTNNGKKIPKPNQLFIVKYYDK